MSRKIVAWRKRLKKQWQLLICGECGNNYTESLGVINQANCLSGHTENE